jgi:hypothetical protein
LHSYFNKYDCPKQSLRQQGSLLFRSQDCTGAKKCRDFYKQMQVEYLMSEMLKTRSISEFGFFHILEYIHMNMPDSKSETF